MVFRVGHAHWSEKNSRSYTTMTAHLAEFHGFKNLPNSSMGKCFEFCKQFNLITQSNQPMHLVFAVKNFSQASVIDQGHPLHTFAAKLPRYVADMKEIKGGCALNHLRQIKDLVEIVISSDDPEAREKAYFALISLEAIDDSMSALNDQVSRWVNHDDRKARARLARFVLGETKEMQLHFAIKPFNSCINKGIAKEDFWHIEEIVIGPNGGCYVDNLQDIAKREGFKVVAMPQRSDMPDIEWLRDMGVILDNKEILVPSRMGVKHPSDPNGIFIIGPTKKYQLQLLIDAFYGEESDSMGLVAHQRIPDQLLRFPGVKEAPFYFEGGNLIPTLNKSGEKIYISGSNNLLYSFFNSHSLFCNNEEKRNLIQEMQSLEGTSQLSGVQERLKRVGLPSTEQAAKLTIVIMHYFEKQMAKTLGHPVLTIGDPFKPLVEVHVDLFMCPLPGGVVLLQDFGLCKELLLKIRESYHLSEEEQVRLTKYLNQAELREKKFGADLVMIAAQLKDAGFEVVLTPGSFDIDRGGKSVDFLNAIAGQNQEGPFCISNGSSHPVDRYLRQEFARLLGEHGVRVYFTGKETRKSVWDPATPYTYSKAEESLRTGGGIHCRTQEINSLIKTFPHFQNCSNRNRFSPSPLVGDSLPKFFEEILQEIKE